MSHYLTEEEIKAKAEEVASLQENSMIAKEYLVPKRVRREIADALPGFVSHKAFFRSLTGGFTPISVSTSGKRRLVSKIGQIHGQPEKKVLPVVRDWIGSAIVREVRKYGNGETFVRFEAKYRRAEHKGEESDPLMLMLALSPRGRMLRYTFVFGTGRNLGGVNIYTSRDGAWKRSLNALSDLRKIVRTMKTGDFFIVEGVNNSSPFFQAWCDHAGDGGVFTVEYALISFSWHFSTKNLLRRKELLRLVDCFAEGGFRELGDAADWGQLPAEEMPDDEKEADCKSK